MTSRWYSIRFFPNGIDCRKMIGTGQKLTMVSLKECGVAKGTSKPDMKVNPYIVLVGNLKIHFR